MLASIVHGVIISLSLSSATGVDISSHSFQPDKEL